MLVKGFKKIQLFHIIQQECDGSVNGGVLWQEKCLYIVVDTWQVQTTVKLSMLQPAFREHFLEKGDGLRRKCLTATPQ